MQATKWRKLERRKISSEEKYKKRHKETGHSYGTDSSVSIAKEEEVIKKEKS